MPKIESYTQGTPSYVELMTPDQQAAKAFYGSLFGWEIEEVPLDDQGSVYLAAEKEGDSVAGIAGQMPELAGHPAFWGVYLAVDDVDTTAAKVGDAGGKVEAGPFDVMDLGRMASIQDPTGARVNLWQAGTTPDLATATKFYSDVLGVGWETMEMPGGEYTCLVVEGRQVGGAMPPQSEGIPPHWNVYFNVEDVDASMAQAQELGAQVVAPAFDVPGVGRMGFLADPQGATFAVVAGATQEG